MPIPKPTPKETEDTYISRCMEAIGSEYDTAEQALAVCYSQFKTDKGTRLSVADRITLYLNYIRRKETLKETTSNLKEAGDPCWEGYEQYGTKIMDGREVPNCIPIKE